MANRNDLERALNGDKNLRGANLRGANLTGANLTGANLREADIDYSAWPLWCGSVGVIVDVRIAEQLAGHGTVVKVDLTGATDKEKRLVTEWQDACRELGKLGHRAKELGLLEETDE